jgi:hypothetical protein
MINQESVKTIIFEIHAGGVTTDGKTRWPNHLTLKMDRWFAFDLLSSLANGLKDEDRQEFTFSWTGKVEPE